MAKNKANAPKIKKDCQCKSSKIIQKAVEAAKAATILYQKDWTKAEQIKCAVKVHDGQKCQKSTLPSVEMKGVPIKGGNLDKACSKPPKLDRELRMKAHIKRSKAARLRAKASP